MAENPNSPLRQELGEVQWMRDLLGQGGNTPAQYMNPQQYMVPDMSAEQLNSLMTNWLRTDGRFLDMNRMAPMAGIYNSSTQQLLQNDLMAQAALKAATANVDIRRGNTDTAARVAGYNAANKAGTQDPKRKQEDALLALLLAGATQGNNVFNSLGKLGQVGSSVGNWFSEKLAGDITQGGAFTDAPTVGAGAYNSPDMSEFSVPDFALGFDPSVVDGMDWSGGAADYSTTPDLTDADWEDLIGSSGGEAVDTGFYW